MSRALARRGSAAATRTPQAGIADMLALASGGSSAIALPSNAIILADVSDSMSDRAGRDGRSRRIDVLRDALRQIQGGTIVPFNGHALPMCSADAIPSPHGGTDVVTVLDEIKPMRPSVVLLICDGEWYDWRGDGEVTGAVRNARALGCVVNTLFVGNPGDLSAIGQMRALADATGGTFATHDMGAGAPLLAAAVSSLLALPQNAGIAL